MPCDCDSLVRQRPVARSNFQPCMVQVSVLPSVTPNRVRSPRRCGHRRWTIQSPSRMSPSSWSWSAYQPSAYISRSGARHLKNVYTCSL
ncbi:MAG TPA: hypothetical protein VE343_15885 [Streptosporangiaceae bacterium]|nr:hypothetical protein [Streptosporangiaceae bacterium]